MKEQFMTEDSDLFWEITRQNPCVGNKRRRNGRMLIGKELEKQAGEWTIPGEPQWGLTYQWEPVKITPLMLSFVKASVLISKLIPLRNISKAPLPHLKVILCWYHLHTTLRIFWYSVALFYKVCETIFSCALQLDVLSTVCLFLLIFSSHPLFSPPLFILFSLTQSFHFSSFS